MESGKGVAHDLIVNTLTPRDYFGKMKTRRKKPKRRLSRYKRLKRYDKTFRFNTIIIVGGNRLFSLSNFVQNFKRSKQSWERS